LALQATPLQQLKDSRIPHSGVLFCFLRLARGEAILWGYKTQNSCRWVDLRLAVSDRFVRLAGFCRIYGKTGLQGLQLAITKEIKE
jgi:hypothetical protein